MAAFRQHVAVSTVLGVGYGAAAYFGFGIDWPTCVIAAGLTGYAGMLPDLDSPTGQPVREVFGLIAALVPVLLVEQLRAAVATVYESLAREPAVLTPQAMVVIIAASYFAVRFGGAWLLDRLTVHRGMFHSIPAALITAVVAFLLLQGPTLMLRLFLAGGPLLGFLSHLIMDEIWSVKLTGSDAGLKKS
ncbi:MAG: metal-dependent hydrolase, partial [Planctomycetes bacterium]|nr:metal-dependent hydrolase [Planctomycetota bacterium]